MLQKNCLPFWTIQITSLILLRYFLLTEKVIILFFFLFFWCFKDFSQISKYSRVSISDQLSSVIQPWLSLFFFLIFFNFYLLLLYICFSSFPDLFLLPPRLDMFKKLYIYIMYDFYQIAIIYIVIRKLFTIFYFL
jgi:hypothetical protein